MSKHHIQNARQISLFDSQRLAGTLNRKEAVCEALVRAFDMCPLSRDKAAEELTRLTCDQISVHHINNWCSQSKGQWRFPLEYLAAVIEVTGDDGALARAAIEGIPLSVIGEDEAPLLELGRMWVEEKARAKRKRRLMEEMGV